MANVTKAAQAAALEATGVSEKLEFLRREFSDALNVSKNEMSVGVRDLRKEMQTLRSDSAADRQAMLSMMDAFRADAATDRQAMLSMMDGFRADAAGVRTEMQALRSEAAADRQAVFSMVDGFRTDAAAVRTEMQALRSEVAADKQETIDTLKSFIRSILSTDVAADVRSPEMLPIQAESL